jgi:hypothetical protein
MGSLLCCVSRLLSSPGVRLGPQSQEMARLVTGPRAQARERPQRRSHARRRLWQCSQRRSGGSRQCSMISGATTNSTLQGQGNLWTRETRQRQAYTRRSVDGDLEKKEGWRTATAKRVPWRSWSRRNEERRGERKADEIGKENQLRPTVRHPGAPPDSLAVSLCKLLGDPHGVRGRSHLRDSQCAASSPFSEGPSRRRDG